MNAPIKPCPFCGRGQTDVEQVNQWHAVLVHWCELKNHPQPSNGIRMYGATVADAIAQWNRRAGGAA